MEVGSPKQRAAGLPGVLHSLRHTVAEPGIARGTRVLRRINQVHGFDCPSCAWPDDPDRRHIEFCENGAKAASWEATPR